MAVAQVRRRQRRTRGSRVPGLVRRGTRAYYQRRMPDAVGGDRIYRTLDVSYDDPVAIERAQALNVIWARGDWRVIRRWVAGELHITEIQHAVEDGTYGNLRRVVADPKLGALVEAWLRRCEGVTPRSYVRQHAITQALLEHFGPDFPIFSLTCEQAEAFLHKPRAMVRYPGEVRPWAARTQSAARVTARAMWAYAIRAEADECIARGVEPPFRRNPWTDAAVARDHTSRPQVLSRREVGELLSHPEVRGTPAATAIAIGAWAGLRIAEMAYLRPGIDVVLGDKPLIRVQARDGDHPWRPKTKNSERDVPITPELATIIQDHILRGYASSRYLFRTPGSDRPVAVCTLRRWIYQAFEAAGLKCGQHRGDGLTPHSLRHTHATMLLSAGASVAVVAERLGDTQQVVLNTYSHAIPDDHDRVLRILSRAAEGVA